MVVYLDSSFILILLSLPLQFGIMSDSNGKIMTDIRKGWIKKKEFTYWENYFAEKLAYYFGMISTVSLVFIYYRVGKMRLIISILFFSSGITWLFYFGVKENNFYLLLIIRVLQGIYMGGLQLSHFIYVMHFVSDKTPNFFGCLTQFSMFVGLFLLNFLMSLLKWNVVVIILFVQSIVFGGLIWIVPEIHIKPKSLTREYVYSKEHLKNLIVAAMLMVFQLMSGIGVVLNELKKMMEGIGLNLTSPVESCTFDFVGALSTLIAAFITDAIGSKYMWAISCFGLCGGLAVYALTLKIKLSNWVGTLCVFVYFLFYGLGVGPIAWYIGSTLFPENVRLESSAVVLFVNLFVPQILDLAWKSLKEHTGQFGSSVLCSIVCLISMIFGIIFIPDEINVKVENINIF